MESFQGGFIFEEKAELQRLPACMCVRVRVRARDGDIEAEMEREV